ncbi:SDR family NAD(P)-dependent oxidoreductase [Streptomyces flavochromogenes]|uniref:SDR family NAD(P)-dependent oxidoreductase n=1 Tax=Streptomyces flavochromogenes TaxID=68199 RepID=UPI0004BF3543|nr:SDR family NAD(P)-dependent oxidoreductase [Streptomyces flavochromogenes]
MSSHSTDGGRVALVTGSSSGIGAAVARRLAGAGYRVVVNSARSVEAGERLAAELPGAVYLQADVSDETQAGALVARAVETLGRRLDLLVNCAGTTRFIAHDDLEAASPEVWRHLYDVNVIGVWQTVTAAVPHLRKTRGAIVNVSSQLLAKALGPDVRVNAVAPGLIDTPWFDGVEGADQAKAHVAEVVPLRRVGRAEDIAGAVHDLAHSAYITGEVLLVDGGGHLLG